MVVWSSQRQDASQVCDCKAVGDFRWRRACEAVEEKPLFSSYAADQLVRPIERSRDNVLYFALLSFFLVPRWTMDNGLVFEVLAHKAASFRS